MTEEEYEGLTVVFTDSEGNKKGKKRTIIYPIFYIMAEACDDAFWKYKLMEFSVGKMPTRYRYIPDSRMLAYKKRTKDFTVEFLSNEDYPSEEDEENETHTVRENVQRFKDFMRTTTGVISPTEIQEDLPETDSPREKKTWTQIMKSKNLSLHYIAEYCKAMKAEHNLDPIAYNSLLYAVDDLRLSGAISKCVSFDGDEITHIGNIYQDKDTGYFHSVPERHKRSLGRSDDRRSSKKTAAKRSASERIFDTPGRKVSERNENRTRATKDVWEKVREIYANSIGADL